jgi:hypothetical protein
MGGLLAGAFYLQPRSLSAQIADHNGTDRQPYAQQALP